MSRSGFLSLDSLDIHTIEVLCGLSESIQVLFQVFFLILGTPEITPEKVTILLKLVQVLVNQSFLDGQELEMSNVTDPVAFLCVYKSMHKLFKFLVGLISSLKKLEFTDILDGMFTLRMSSSSIFKSFKVCLNSSSEVGISMFLTPKISHKLSNLLVMICLLPCG